MTHVLFEEDGAFKAGTVLSDAGASLQVEHASGRRVKVKSGHVMLRFDTPGPGDMVAAAQRLADEIDVDFLWECAPQDEFGFVDLATEYFGRAPTPSEATGLLLRLHAAPVYFHRKGRGRYRPAPPDTLKAALAAVERKRQQEAQVEADAQALVEGRAPEAIVRSAAFLLVKPDKQSLEWRALDRACTIAQQTPARLLMAAGAFASTREMHFACFSAEWFPHGTGFPASVADAASAVAGVPGADGAAPDWSHLPLASVQPFSIDDSTTTEIDDCLSVQTLPDGRYRIGIHIAAPGLGMTTGAPLDLVARERMSTVYTPGRKITMLPEAAIGAYSLDEGREVPALSLYLDLDVEGKRIVERRSLAERIRVAANLRHDRLDAEIDEARLAGDDPWDFAFAQPLRVLWKLMLASCAERERVRGKPEPRFRTDFSFYIEGESVKIVQRRRDAPLDRIVAELMILANSEWGRMLADYRVPGIYRSQQQGRVRMTTHPLAHQGLGVSQYSWCTSPLRRYVDLVNQRQLLAVLAGEPAPFSAKDTELFAIMSSFDARYAAYAEFQTRMERWWCLRWLEQQGLRRVEAVVVRDDLVRLVAAPFYFRLPDLPQLAAGRRIVVDILERDEIALDVSARFVELATGTGDGSADALGADEDMDAGGDGTAVLAPGGLVDALAPDGAVPLDPAAPVVAGDPDDATDLAEAIDSGAAASAAPAEAPEEPR